MPHEHDRKDSKSKPLNDTPVYVRNTERNHS